MLTSLFLVTRIFSNPLSNVFQKKLTGDSADPLFIILVTHFLISLAVLPILFFILPLQLGIYFWINIVICALLAIAGNTLIVAALKSTDLSILGPINAYKSIVSIVLGIFLLGEYPTWMGIAGIAMIIFGSYFILDKNPATPGKNLLAQFFENKGVLLRFAALVLSATEAIFLKKALLLSSPLVTFIFWCVLGLPVAYLAAAILSKGKIREEIVLVGRGKNNILALALTTGLMQLSTLYTFGVLQVGYSLALFQISTLLSVFFGYKFFQEQNILRRLLGAGIMVLGAATIIIFGSHS
jgi:drug/metabolite transporter (DMT)-like permease